MGRTSLGAKNRVVALTVGMVVLAGILSGAAAFLSTRHAIDEYNEVMILELEQKGLAFAQVGQALLPTRGNEALPIIDSLIGDALESSEELATDPPAVSPEGFQNPLIGFQAWATNSNEPSGYAIVSSAAIDGMELELSASESIRRDLVATTAATGEAHAAVDRERQMLHGSFPIGAEDEVLLIGTFTLGADDEFAFFAQQRANAIRDSILASAGIVIVVAVVGGALSVYVSRDLTNRSQVEEQLRDQARRDPLTGVLNHAAIIEELDRVLSKGPDHSTAVIMADVDGMKATNDTFGHQIGDAALRAAAKAFDRDGAILGRYGGDEFVVVLDGYDRPAGERYLRETAERLAAITLTDPDSGVAVPVSISMGIAVCPAEAATVTELVGLADTAMYASRLQRPLPSSGQTMPRRRDEDALMMIGELVPFLTSEDALDDRLRLVAHRLTVATRYDGVSIAIVDPATGRSLIKGFVPAPDEGQPSWHERDGGQEALWPSIRRTRRPMIVNDIPADTRLTEADRSLAKETDVRSFLIAPMLWRDELLGTLTVTSRSPDAFTPKNAQFFTTVGREIAAIARLALGPSDEKRRSAA